MELHSAWCVEESVPRRRNQIVALKIVMNCSAAKPLPASVECYKMSRVALGTNFDTMYSFDSPVSCQSQIIFVSYTSNSI